MVGPLKPEAPASPPAAGRGVVTDKIITCPPLCGVALNLRGEVVEFGLVEYVHDFLLREIVAVPELHEFLKRMMKAMPTSMRGPSQVAKAIELSVDDWKVLCSIARKERSLGGPENLVMASTCNRAILLAVDAPAPAAQAAE